jgi:transcriptional regulator of acetoin/glycerol metabolism
LVVRDVSNLTGADQLRLLEWIRKGTRTQVLSMTREPLYPLVRQGRFSEDLFYLLNISKIGLFGDDDREL